MCQEIHPLLLGMELLSSSDGKRSRVQNLKGVVVTVISHQEIFNPI